MKGAPREDGGLVLKACKAFRVCGALCGVGSSLEI